MKEETQEAGVNNYRMNRLRILYLKEFNTDCLPVLLVVIRSRLCIWTLANACRLLLVYAEEKQIASSTALLY